MPETTFHTTFSTSHFWLSRAKNGSERGLWSAVSYRFGFNGKENDNEVKGTGNQQDYGMRIYDPRIGRFLSADPLIVQGQMYPELSPYQFASLNPIKMIDFDGLEGKDTEVECGKPVLCEQDGQLYGEQRNAELRGGLKNETIEESKSQYNIVTQFTMTMLNVAGAATSASNSVINSFDKSGYWLGQLKDGSFNIYNT